MSDIGLRFVGPGPGRWLQRELTDFGGRVGCIVPGSYPAFARILHRIDPEGRALRWSEVCEASGAVAHPLMQWHLVCQGWHEHSDSDPLQGRSDEDPRVGSLDPMSIAALYDVLSRASGSNPVFHAFWNGWGGLHRSSVGVFEFGASGRARRPADSAFPFPPEVVGGATLDLPGREHLVFLGALDASLFAGRPGSVFWPQSPSLSWPDDHSWCVATEIDFDSTLLAGPVSLVDAILADPELEAWPVTADDRLTVDADTINAP